MLHGCPGCLAVCSSSETSEMWYNSNILGAIRLDEGRYIQSTLTLQVAIKQDSLVYLCKVPFRKYVTWLNGPRLARMFPLKLDGPGGSSLLVFVCLFVFKLCDCTQRGPPLLLRNNIRMYTEFTVDFVINSLGRFGACMCQHLGTFNAKSLSDSLV